MDQIITAEEKCTLLIECLKENKAEDITVLPLKGKSDIADFFICASGLSPRHLKTLAEKLNVVLKETTGEEPELSGLTECFWVLIDANNIVLHLFRPEVRSYYDLESLWK